MSHDHRQHLSSVVASFCIGVPVLLICLPPILRAFAAALNFLGSF